MEEKKATKIRKLKLTSVDMVRRGANPDAHINLYKSAEGNPADKPEDATNNIVKAIVDGLKAAFGMNEVEKKADTFEEPREVQDNRAEYQDALTKSIDSILDDESLTAVEKSNMMADSIEQFADAYAEMCAQLIGVQKAADGPVELEKAEDEETVEEDDETPVEDQDEPENDEEDLDEEAEEEKEEGDREMKIDKSRFTAEELELYNGLIAKGLVEDEEEEYVPEPEKEEEPEAEDEVEKSEDVEKSENMETSEDVQKALADALAEMEELKKSMEMKELTNIAKKYTVLGKKEDELAQTLYAMKKSGQEFYDNYIAVLDQSADIVEKSGMFVEIGKSSRNTTAGGDVMNRIESIATEIQKADPSLNRTGAIAKAWEQHPELAEEYEANY